MLRFALRELHRAAPEPVDVVMLPAHAPFGAVEIDTAGCTLCLSCVAACPTGALSDDPQRPMLRFTEEACVQCGLCQATCPEKVITLKPQLDFRAAIRRREGPKGGNSVLLHPLQQAVRRQEHDRARVAKLADKHWMFKESAERLDLIKMCDDCRVAFVSEREFDPYGPPRPPVRTTDDYLRERDQSKAAEKKDGG